jgi:hypothetical protein
MVVDFPAPLGPKKPVTRPGRTRNDSSSTASASLYCLVKPIASIMGSTVRMRRRHQIRHREAITTPPGVAAPDRLSGNLVPA